MPMCTSRPPIGISSMSCGSRSSSRSTSRHEFRGRDDRTLSRDGARSAADAPRARAADLAGPRHLGAAAVLGGAGRGAERVYELRLLSGRQPGDRTDCKHAMGAGAGSRADAVAILVALASGWIAL